MPPESSNSKEAPVSGAVRMRPAGLRGTALLLVLAGAGCGHVVAPDVPFQHAPRFDFRNPPCHAAPAPAQFAPEDSVVVRYLGAGGLYIGWRGEALLTGPFFSNPGLWRSGLGRIRPNPEAIRRGLEGMPTGTVGAVLAGHSHHDHIADLPWVAEKLKGDVSFYLNRSGANALEGFPALGPPGRRIKVLEELKEGWTRLSTASGKALPFRMLALPSHHANHLGPIKLFRGETRTGRSPSRLRNRHLKEGQTYAFVLDLLGAEEEGSPVRFRIYYQDAAAKTPQGFPPEGGEGEHPYDLAVVCMASAQWVKPYPDDLLRALKPRHVLVTHYENFFRPWGTERGFAPLLFNRHADRFLEAVDAALTKDDIPDSPPGGKICGPSAPPWTMPLTGEWMVFRPSQETASLPER